MPSLPYPKTGPGTNRRQKEQENTRLPAQTFWMEKCADEMHISYPTFTKGAYANLENPHNSQHALLSIITISLQLV